jgi:hypothetical protein
VPTNPFQRIRFAMVGGAKRAFAPYDYWTAPFGPEVVVTGWDQVSIFMGL